MQKVIPIIVVFVLFGLNLQAQTIRVTGTKLVKNPDNSASYYPRFSPAGDYLLVTSHNYAGLRSYDFSTQKFTSITTDAGAGYNSQISSDGKTILYNKTEMIKNLRHNTLVQTDRTGRVSKKLTTPDREPVPARFSTNQATYVRSRKLTWTGAAAPDIKPIITIEDRKMVIYTATERKVITPNGEKESYFWPVISPDGRKIVYTVAGKNTFVCNIDGSKPLSLGYVNAPQWLNNNWIVGMNDKDDGEKLISSELIAVRVDGKTRQRINTPEGKMAMYPAVSADGTRVAFNTDKGEVFVLTVDVK